MQDIFDGKEIKTPNSNVPVPLSINFTPQNPMTIQGSVSSIHPEDEEKKPFEVGIEKEPYHAGLFETAKAQFGRMSSVANASSFLTRFTQDSNPLDDEVSPGWKPTDDITAFEGVKSQNIGYLLNSTSPKDLRRRYNSVLDLQQKDELVENGSTLGWLLGGFTGLSPIGSPEGLIPIAGQVKYARYAPTIINSMGRAFPGMLASSAIHNAATEANNLSGNLENWAVSTAIDASVGTAFMGAIGGASRFIDSAAIWDIRKSLLPYYHGIDFKVKVTPEGKFNGFQAVDSTGGNLSAAEVSFAQDYADSTMAKSGIFKIPFVGNGATKLFEVFSPLVRMMNSKFTTERGVADRVADHSFVTEGIEKGKPAPQKFENLMNQLQGSNRALAVQLNGLHVQRNGFDISNRAVNTLQNTKAKIMKNGYISREEFGKEIRDVLINDKSSGNSSVNQAAELLRSHIDDSYRAFRQAYNLPEEWMSPKTAEGYLMRVYNTNYMTLKENEWHDTITSWLAESDEMINARMEPINTLSETIKDFEAKHTQAVHILANLDAKRIESAIPELKQVEKGITTTVGEEKSVVPFTTQPQKGSPEYELRAMRNRLKAMQEQLQNELRANPDMRIHVEDWNALSANEAKEVKQLTSKLTNLEKQITEQKKVISDVKAAQSKKLSSAKNATQLDKAVYKSKKYVAAKDAVKVEEDKLSEMQRAYDEEDDLLQQRMHSGEIKSHLFTKEKDSFRYNFRDPDNRLKFRDTYLGDAERRTASKAYYDTIMNQTPEQTIGQIMGRLSGNAHENPLGRRTLLIPDKVLYENNFLSNDIIANVVNYRNYLGRKTFMKNVFSDVTIDGGFEPVIENLVKEYEGFRAQLNKNLSEIKTEQDKLDKAFSSMNDEEKKTAELQKADLESRKKDIEKETAKLRDDFNTAKERLGLVYDKMMGRRIGSAKANKYRDMVMSYTAAIRLGFVPFTMMTDLSANILQHGLWPFIRDGLVPAIESLGGLLKTKDSEALRKAAPHVNLALQDVLTGYADKNYGSMAMPYLNMGNKLANGLEGLAHLSSNLAGTTYLENGLQHITSAIMQSKIMEGMFQFKNGTLSPKDLKGLLKYGLDPKEWADRFIEAFGKYGGEKTKLGGYQSNFWQWQDMEAANKMGDTVFRGTKDTVLARGMLDAPFFMDNPLGSILMGFKGWTYASLTRYVIPSMQQADGQKLLGIAFMLGAGALVSPTRRLASGKSPYPDDVTPGQIAYAAFQDSGYFSFFGDMLADINLFTGGTLMRNLKNDRYRDRTLAGLLGPSAGIGQDMYSVAGMMWSGEINQSDVNKLTRLVPFTQLTEFRGLTNKAVESLELPKTRAQARRMSAND